MLEGFPVAATTGIDLHRLPVWTDVFTIFVPAYAGMGAVDCAVAAILAQTSEDFFETIDTSKIPNYANLKYKDNVIGDSFIPYRGTSAFLAYNNDAVSDAPTTADEPYQWIKDHPGRFTYNDPSTGNSCFAFVANTI